MEYYAEIKGTKYRNEKHHGKNLQRLLMSKDARHKAYTLLPFIRDGKTGSA